jgi:hypothetical protein
MLLDLMTPIIFGEEYELWISLLCSFRPSHVTIPLRPQNFPKDLVLKHPQPVFLLKLENSFKTHTKQQVKSQYVWEIKDCDLRGSKYAENLIFSRM